MTEQILEEMIKHGAELKASITDQTRQLREINLGLEKALEFNGKKSTSVTAAGFNVKVAKRDNVKWNQKRLTEIREHFSDTFNESFRTEFKPIAKALANADPEFTKAIDWCRTIKAGAPTVTYESLEEL